MNILSFGIRSSLQTLVVTKFWTGFSLMIFISSMMALLQELVVSPATAALLTFPSVVAIGQKRSHENWQSLLVGLIIFQWLSRQTTRSFTSLSSRDLLDGEVMALIGPVSPKKLNPKWRISPGNQTYLYVSLALTLF